ncbi:hypothetical protein DM01DRAFT_1212786 [Hesseltinella vesiculosa]|uniref:F-box domain-containing protein n=1 Tax=Hesseltinella vesiculosa TaxID=101127 RepID=A0A1X2G2K0_9FUNG|nr:hypothetical protein DM01DRAFT_1212786 [Hesseltinella vesiculosa]
MSRFANVPLEITRCIASYLPSHSLLELCCTCKSLQAALLLDLYRQIHLSDPQRLVFLLNALVHSSNIFDRRDAIHTLILAFPIDTLLLEVLAVLCPRATRFDISHPAQHPPSPLTSDLVSQYRAQVFPDRTQFSVRPCLVCFITSISPL